VALAIALAQLALASAAFAVPPDFTNQVVIPGITAAVTLAFLPDGRMLVGELTGNVWVVQPGASTPDPTPFLQIDTSLLFGEQGLMDVLPDPSFAQNGYFYVFYTRGFTGQNNRNRLSRFTASGNGTLPGSELVLWQDVENADYEHHAGAIVWGNDDKLYFTYGDQFVANSAQDLTSYRGKLLRINPDGSIPTDNPFYDGAGPNRDEIWAYGLRNPYRMSIDVPTGRIFIGDVGGNHPPTAWEEINLAARGANYGWPLCEGACPQVPGVTSPIHAYPHIDRDACITAGFVYRGTQFPLEYRGSFFFADYVQNWIKRLTFDSNGNVSGVVNFEPIDGTPDTAAVGDPVKLVQAPDGSMLYVDLGFNDAHVPNDAAIRRIRYSPSNQPPIAVAAATPQAGQAPLLVDFSSAGSLDPEGLPLSYAWTFGDGNTSTLANPTHSYAANGAYVARLTVSDGANQSVSDDLDISVGNAPIATITTPADASSFRAGDAIVYSGSATDVEDGDLPASAFSWLIRFHHDGHIHPGGGPFTGTTSGTLTIPTSGHDFEGATSYEIDLTVTDSDGLKGTTSVTVVPEKVSVPFDSAPSGLAIDVDGIRKITPFALDDVIGFTHVISAPPQVSGGISYTFQSWSDGGAASHSIFVPESGGSWQATFAPSGTSPDLVAAYSFDEGIGTTVQDASGHGNDGTLQGPTWTLQGRFGGALEFSGGGLVLVPDSPSLDLTTEMTLEAWVRPTQTGDAWKDVVYKANDVYYLEGASPNSGVPATGGTYAASPLYSNAGPLPQGTWSHLAATYDGATLRLFLNGVQVASRPESGPIQVSSDPLTIGGDGIYGQFFVGLIDDVRVYDVALDANQIQNDMVLPVPEPSAWQQLGAGGLTLVLLARARARRARTRASR
jgi:glucose/arabinose dehydrogenase/chitodextrinase